MSGKRGEQPTVVRRAAPARRGFHGGAWKLAYADFMTAMMAFFLLMWLLNSATNTELAGIAEYFRTPLKVAIMGGDKYATSSGVIPGGAPDTMRRDGQRARSDATRPARSPGYDGSRAIALAEHEDATRLRALQSRLLGAIEANPVLRQFRKQLLIDITTEGLRIQIVDNRNRPMFANGSAQVQPYMRDILREIGRALNDVPNRISLSGHTDAALYASGDRSYSNWELSADRANASRRELIAGGMDAGKVLRVVGLASTVNLDRHDPLDPINRRISIVVLNRRAEAQLAREADADTIDAANRPGAGRAAVAGAASSAAAPH